MVTLINTIHVLLTVVSENFGIINFSIDGYENNINDFK